MSVKDLYPAIRPSLNLDFANTKTLDPRITFSRASTGTYYDGVTHAKAEENLLTYSQEFNTGWTVSNVTVTADDTAAPDGTNTAEKLAVLGNSSAQSVARNGVFTQTSTGYTLSIYAKAGTLSYFFLAYRGNSSNVAIAEWDLSTGTLNASNASGTAVIDSTSIASVGSGWYRLVLNVTTSTGNADARFAFGPTDGTFSNFGYYLGSTAGDAYAWGAQLEQRSSVTAYTATTTQPITNYIPVLQSAAAGEARFDHDPVTGESKGLLSEGQRTNLLTYSEDFSNAAWSKFNASIDSNVIVAPDGTLTGDKFVPDATTIVHNIAQVGFSSGAYTASIYAKAGGETTFSIWLRGATVVANFDLDSGTILSTSGSVTATITPVGNGWYRCTAYDPTPGTTLHVYGRNGGVFTGDGYSGIFIWGAQLEAGAFPTSYIKTTSAQATRSADSASMTGTNFSEWYRQDEGSVVTEFQTAIPLGSRLNNGIFSIEKDSDNLHRVYLPASDALNWQFRSGGSTVFADAVSASFAPNVFSKAAIAFESGSQVSSLNGAAITTHGTSTAPQPDATTLKIGYINTSDILNGTIKRLAYYPARLTNAQLQALTEG